MERVPRGRQGLRGEAPSFPVLWSPVTRALYVFFFSLSLFRHLSPRSRSRWHLTKERRARMRAMRAGGETRGEIYYGARRAVAGSYFKIRRAHVPSMVCLLVYALRVLMATIRWTDGVMVDRCTTSA